MKEAKKMKNPQLLQKIIEQNKDKYQYFVEDFSTLTRKQKIKIGCIEHNIVFEQIIEGVLRESLACKECSSKKKKTPQIDFSRFVELARKRHGNKYSYDEDSYINVSEKISIYCSIHGHFIQAPYKHYGGRGCPDCGLDIKRAKAQTPKEGNSFKDRSKIAIQNWDYENNTVKPDEISVKSSAFKIKWKCCKCDNKWDRTPKVELMGNGGCLKCGFGREIIELPPEKGKSLAEKFPELLKSYSDKNTIDPYSLRYNSRIKVLWICTKGHDEWETSVHKRTVLNRGCIVCRESQGEKSVNKILREAGIKPVRQWTHRTLIGVGGKRLRVDFALPESKILIEYDGEQHFSSKASFGKVGEDAERTFKIIQANDTIKNQWAKENGWIMFRISYKESIEDKMNELLENSLICIK